MRCLRVADVCLPETEIRAENWQAARRWPIDPRRQGGRGPNAIATNVYLRATCFLLRESRPWSDAVTPAVTSSRGGVVRGVAWIVAVEGMWRAANVGCRYRPQTGMRKMRFVWRGSQRKKPTPPRMKRVGWMGTLSCIAGDPHCTNVSAFDSFVVKADHPISDCTGRHGNRGKRLTNVGSRAIAFRAAGHDNSYRDSFVRHAGK